MDAARSAGATVEEIDFSDWRLPAYDDSLITGELHPEVARLRALVGDCDALLFATPVYHDSLSGVLKLALDLIPSDLLAGRVAGLIAVGGGRHGHGLALEHLRTVLREMGVWTLPRQVIVPSAQELLDEAGRIQEPEILSRLTALGSELVLSTTELRPPSMRSPRG